ncbi:MAG: alpha/beta hydrolase [Chloroflexi bacterium]|nr:alpha/beta hydrolase [Chloroflexota bacterium]
MPQARRGHGRCHPARTTADMPTVHINGIDVWHERSGGGGPTLVLTHGFAGPSSYGWPLIIEEFKRRFDLVLYDARAHGKTTVPDPATVTVPQFAADLAALLDVLGIDRAHIGGVSMGGMISAQFACDYPERLRSLLLCDTIAGNAQGHDEAANAVERLVLEAFERIGELVERYGTEELVRRENRYRREKDPYAHLSSLSLDEQDEKNRRQKVECMTKEGFLAAARAVRERPDLTSRTPGIKAPTLVSCGEWDLFYPGALRDHRLIANSRLVTIQGAAHSTPDYTPELWLRACTDFIDDVEAGIDIRGEFILDGHAPAVDGAPVGGHLPTAPDQR